jgi:hypothetical protein
LACARLLVISGCSPNTKITGSWKSPAISRNYHHVFVTALTANTVVRSTVEEEMAKALKARGLSATKSLDVFPPGFAQDSVNRATIVPTIRKMKADGILTISVQKKETETRYVSGGYAPASQWNYYGSYGGYYNHMYPTVYNPGYYEQQEVYYLETNLYDSSSELLVWSAQSRTYIYDDLPSLTREFASIVVSRMAKEGVLK